MIFLNDSDFNAEGTFHRAGGSDVDFFPVHMRGYSDSVTVEDVPVTGGRTELVLSISGEAGHSGVAMLMRDLLKLAMQHHPELVAEVQRELAGSDAGEDSDVPEVLTGYAAYGQRG